jgi:hypothetical protein
VRNAEEVPKPGGRNRWGKWLPIPRKTPKGKKPHGRKPRKAHYFAGGSEVIKLWRGAKGSERIVRKSQSLFRALGDAKTSWTGESQGRRGSEEPIRSLASSSVFSGNLVNPRRGGLLFGDEKQSIAPVAEAFEAAQHDGLEARGWLHLG